MSKDQMSTDLRTKEEIEQALKARECLLAFCSVLEGVELRTARMRMEAAGVNTAELDKVIARKPLKSLRPFLLDKFQAS